MSPLVPCLYLIARRSARPCFRSTYLVEDALCFVQFLHPGGEHGHERDSRNRKEWNRGVHQRKFLASTGTYLSGGTEQEGAFGLWGEWEPPSRVAEYPQGDGLPRFVHDPILEQPTNFVGLQNTDPFVFGPRFLYTNCQQHTRKGTVETQLRHLTTGSVILFGSCRDESRFVLDTVMVVADHIDHSDSDDARLIGNAVPDDYWAATLKPTYASADSSRSFRLYFGATPLSPVRGMFSFAPCLPKDGGNPPRFARPEIRLGEVTSNLKQGRRTTKLVDTDQALGIWKEVVAQVEAQRLSLAVRVELPTGIPDRGP